MEFGFQYLIEVSVNHGVLAETAKRFCRQRRRNSIRATNGEEDEAEEATFRGLAIRACFSKQRFACLIFLLGPRSPKPKTQFKIFTDSSSTAVDWDIPEDHFTGSKTRALLDAFISFRS